MGGDGKVLTIAAVVIAALILQFLLITADNHDSPSAAAVEFSRAYFKLNPDMLEHLCNEITANDGHEVVTDYLSRVTERAESQGYDANWMKMALFNLKIQTEMVAENVAEVRIDGNCRRSVNPLYGVVAKVFCLGEIYDVRETLTVVRENGHWKVCGEPYELIEG